MFTGGPGLLTHRHFTPPRFRREVRPWRVAVSLGRVASLGQELLRLLRAVSGRHWLFGLAALLRSERREGKCGPFVQTCNMSCTYIYILYIYRYVYIYIYIGVYVLHT